MMKVLTTLEGRTSVSFAPTKPPAIEKIIMKSTYDQTMKPLSKKTVTETLVIKKDSRDFIAVICFKENSLLKERTDSKAIPNPPLKYPPYTLTKDNPNL